MNIVLAMLLAFGAALLALRAAGRSALDTTVLDLAILVLLGHLSRGAFVGELPDARFVVATGSLLVANRLLAATFAPAS